MSSPSPRSFRSRMGHAVRRTSSILSIARPASPSVHSDSGSVKHLDAPSQLIVPPAAPAEHAAPSPIAESPAREAAESSAPAPVPTGPSPLAQTIVHDEPDDMHPHEARPASVVEEVAKVDEAPTAEEAAIEVPKVDEAPPATEVAVEDSRVEEPPRVDEARPTVDETAAASSGANGDAQEANGVAPEADEASVHTQIIDAAVMPDESILSPPPPPAAEYTTSENSYFDVKPVRVEDDAEKDEQLSNQTTPRPNVTHEEESQTFSAMPVPQPHEAPVRMPSYDLGPSESVWGHSTDSSSDYGKAASSNGDALAHEPAPSARMPAEDPFADPVPPITITAEEDVLHPSMPEPQVHKEAPQAEETPVVVMPFPEIQDVIAQRYAIVSQSHLRF
ncbi:hypothetical protein CPB85DRAFT_257945 [Mucidula mucida]|nr:hypothetical protein CPB85DRAFT_257945 [Mucidula mucida]